VDDRVGEVEGAVVVQVRAVRSFGASLQSLRRRGPPTRSGGGKPQTLEASSPMESLHTWTWGGIV
jgi:hypothetical protein